MKNRRNAIGIFGLTLIFALIFAACPQPTEEAPVTYTVSYAAGEGGGNPPAGQTVNAGTAITLPDQGTMTAPAGKTFNGWTAGSGGTFSAGGSYTVNADVTFTARWKAGGTNIPGATPLAEGVYIGILSFDASINPIASSPVLLDAAGKITLQNAIDTSYARAADDGTLLYYGVHKALNTMKGLESVLPTNARSYNIITFTDGLDVGSTDPELWRQEPLDGQDFTGNGTGYLTWLNSRLESTRIKNFPVTASAYGIAGTDVGNQATFASNLAKLVTASGESSTSISFSQLSEKFGAIASSLDVTTTSSSFDLKLRPPTQGNGTLIRMTFDSGVTNPDSSQVYFTGAYNYNAGAYTLTNIEYHGITGSVISITGSRSGMGPINYHFDNFSLTSGAQITPAYIQQWIKGPNDSWNRNSEYDQSNTVTSSTTKSSAVIYLVLDSSKSLNESQIASIRNAAKNFIDVLYNKYYGIGTPEPGPGTPTAPASAPTNVRAEPLSADSIQITWNTVSGASLYYVYGSPSVSGNYTYLRSSAAASHIETQLSPGTTYYFKVAAVNDGGEGPLSEYAAATTQIIQTDGDGIIRVYNDSPDWNIIWVGLYEAESGVMYTLVSDDLFPEAPISYANYYSWTAIPAGQEYVVGINDTNGAFLTSPSFIISPNQTLVVSYDGYGLSLVLYDPGYGP
jgi:hypothetical protein